MPMTPMAMLLAMLIRMLTMPIAVAVSASNATAYSLAAYPRARCLDGSAARYYFRPGANHRKFLIYFEGGGFCESIGSCEARAAGYFGSTTTDEDTPTWPLTYEAVGPYFDLSAVANPLLYDAQHVYVRFCDGAYFSGERHDPIKGVNRTLYFAGKWIVEATIADLAKRGLHEASEIIVAGCSAGAIHLFAHLDWMRALLPQSARVVGFADSGFYVDTSEYTPHKKFVVAPDGHNGTAMLDPFCLSKYAKEKERCLIAPNTAARLQTPTFAWQSVYDLDQRGMAKHFGIQQYGDTLTSLLHSRLLANKTHRHGAFIDGCDRHCTAAGMPHPFNMSEDGLTPFQALAAWYRGWRQVWDQKAHYPCKVCCGQGPDPPSETGVLV